MEEQNIKGLEETLKQIRESQRSLERVLLGDLDGNTGLIQSEKNIRTENHSLIKRVDDHDVRIKSLEDSGMRRTGAAAVVGLLAGFLASFFKNLFHPK